MKIAQMPEPEQIKELMSGPEDTPVVMVNPLKGDCTTLAPVR